MLDNELISKIQSVFKKQIPAFQKGIATSCGIGKDIYVDVNGKSIRAYSYNVSSPGQVNVFYDNTNKIYVAWTEQSNQLLNTINLRLRKSKLRGTVEKLLYPFLEIVAETGITQPYWVIGGNNKTLLLPANSNSPFEMLGLNNLGGGKFTWVGNMNDTYYFGNEVPDTGGSGLVATAIDLTPSHFINDYVPSFDWYGGTELEKSYITTISFYQNTATRKYTSSNSNYFSVFKVGGGTLSLGVEHSVYDVSSVSILGHDYYTGYTLSNSFYFLYAPVLRETYLLSNYSFGFNSIPNSAYNYDGYGAPTTGYVAQYQYIGQPNVSPVNDYYLDDLDGQTYDYNRYVIQDGVDTTSSATYTQEMKSKHNSLVTQTLNVSHTFSGKLSHYWTWFGTQNKKGEKLFHDLTATFTETGTINDPYYFYKLDKNGLNEEDNFVVTTINKSYTETSDVLHERNFFMASGVLGNEELVGSYREPPDGNEVSDLWTGGGNNLTYSISGKESIVTNWNLTYSGTVDKLGEFDYKIYGSVTTPVKVFEKEVSSGNLTRTTDVLTKKFTPSGGFSTTVAGGYDNYSLTGNNSKVNEYENIEPELIIKGVELAIVKIEHSQRKETTTNVYNRTEVTVPHANTGRTRTEVYVGTHLNIGSYTKEIKIYKGSNSYTLDNTYQGFMFLKVMSQDELVDDTPNTIIIDYSWWDNYYGISEYFYNPSKLYTGYTYTQTDNNTGVYSSFTSIPNPLSLSNLNGQRVEVYHIRNGETVVYKGTISNLQQNTYTNTWNTDSYTFRDIGEITLSLTSKEDLDFYCWANIYANAVIIVPSGDHTISLLKYIEQDKSTVNMYEKNDTVQIAISKDPTNDDIGTDQKKWYADIYEFDKTNKKFIRLENQSGALSKINNATTDSGNFISYYPLK